MIEPLEPRIAPAAILVYRDIDTDLVTIKTSKGSNEALSLAAARSNGTFGRLTSLVLGNDFADSDVFISVVRGPSGDGLTTVGSIAASGDLGRVVIAGDLGRIVAGDSDADPALKSLSVTSYGRYGTASGAPNLKSEIHGAMGALQVKLDMTAVEFVVDRNLASVTIGGTLQGGTGTHAGLIYGLADIGPVKIGGSIVGSSGVTSGAINAVGKLGKVSVGGSVIGGSGNYSGQIASDLAMGDVSILGDLRAGSGGDAGKIRSRTTMGNLTVGGSIIGVGPENLDGDGQIYGRNGIGALTVRGSIIGGDATSTGFINTPFGKVKSITIGGSLHGGDGLRSAEIRMGGSGSMGPINIGGSLEGGGGDSSASLQIPSVDPASISIGGSVIGGANQLSGFLQFGFTSTLTVKGSIQGGSAKFAGYINSVGAKTFDVRGNILGGSGDSTGSIQVYGGVAVVKVGGDLIGGSISGDVSLSASGSLSFNGDVGRMQIGGSILAGRDDSTGTLTRSGSITATSFGAVTVKGSIVGTVGSSGDVTNVLITVSDNLDFPKTAIGLITVGGRVERAQITTFFQNIGPVKVAGDWIASSLVSGITNQGSDQLFGGTGTAADNVSFADENDTFNGDERFSRIASITIGGQVLGSPATGDSSGFAAGKVGSLSVSGRKFTIVDPSRVHVGLSGLADDVWLHVL